LLDDLLDTDIAAIEAELKAVNPPVAPAEPRQQPKRTPLPAQFPRTVIRHEPENTQCACGCQLQRIGEDISEKLDYTPGVFTVEQHVRGKWACRQCETLIQAPVPAQVIDKGIPTAGLLAHVMVAKFADHLPLYRQEKIFGRAGLAIARSTLAQWVGQTGVQLQECVHLWLLQVRDLRAGKLPERNRENAPRPFQVFRAVLADEAGKRVQRCQTLVDGPRGEVLVTRR
jgi:transposase